MACFVEENSGRRVRSTVLLSDETLASFFLAILCHATLDSSAFFSLSFSSRYFMLAMASIEKTPQPSKWFHVSLSLCIQVIYMPTNKNDCHRPIWTIEETLIHFFLILLYQIHQERLIKRMTWSWNRGWCRQRTSTKFVLIGYVVREIDSNVWSRLRHNLL